MYKEQYKLKNDELIALIQGKSLNFLIPGQYHIEILPSNHGLKVEYDDWIKIITFLRGAYYSDTKIIDELINKIEKR